MILASLFFASALVSAPAVQAQAPSAKPKLEALTPQDVVARVGELEITRAEHLREFNRLIPLNFYHARVPEGLKAEMERKSLDSVIERNLIALDAADRGMGATDGELRAEFRRTLAKAGDQYANLPEERFEELLKAYRGMIEQRILIDKNEARFTRSIPPVTEEELAAAYQSRKSTLLTPAEARFRSLFFKVDPAASSFEAQAAHDRMQRVHDGILAGTDTFEHVARQASEDIFRGQGGDMGFVTSDSFASHEVGEAAFKLKDGELSEVLDSMYGVHLLRRLETKPPTQMTLEEAHGLLTGDLMAARTDEAREKWLGGIRDRYKVEVLVELPEVIPTEDAAPSGEEASAPTSRPAGGE